LSDLTITYLMTDEENSGWTPTTYIATVSQPYTDITNFTRISLSPMSAPTQYADTRIDFRFETATLLNVPGTLAVDFGILPMDFTPPEQDHSNDYSYRPTSDEDVPWERILVYRGNTLIWGCEPPPP
jgi:hypothetical protein